MAKAKHGPKEGGTEQVNDGDNIHKLAVLGSQAGTETAMVLGQQTVSFDKQFMASLYTSRSNIDVKTATSLLALTRKVVKTDKAQEGFLAIALINMLELVAQNAEANRLAIELYERNRVNARSGAQYNYLDEDKKKIDATYLGYLKEVIKIIGSYSEKDLDSINNLFGSSVYAIIENFVIASKNIDYLMIPFESNLIEKLNRDNIETAINGYYTDKLMVELQDTFSSVFRQHEAETADIERGGERDDMFHRWISSFTGNYLSNPLFINNQLKIEKLPMLHKAFNIIKAADKSLEKLTDIGRREWFDFHGQYEKEIEDLFIILMNKEEEIDYIAFIAKEINTLIKKYEKE